MRHYYKIKDIQNLFECSANWVYVHQHELGAAKIAGRLVFDPSRVDEWVKSRFEANRNLEDIARRVV